MIVIGGEALVDLVPDSSTPDGELGPLHPLLGGGPYNVAIALGRLGVPAAFYAKLSTDQFGDRMLQRLTESEVDTSLVQRGPEPTTLAVVGLEANGSARYSFHTEGTAARFVTDQPLPDGTTALCLGTLGMVLEPGATAYEKVLFREAERGVFIALDPNIRADLIADADAYRARFSSWLPSVGLLKVSDDDAEWLAPGRDVVEAAREWQARGPAAVVLTRGADGLTAVTADGEVTVPGRKVDVADTIGAGDTVQAALLAWLHRNGALSPEQVRALDVGQWEQALSFAAAAAAVTVSRPGAEPPWSAELDA
ncbi:carbohydrate kinase [Saccharopolyspora karakumensis]|uniref:Carbohydrate kinase n=1 Tax=Saccharopolyspora karakumensis TaxID=2530386 RepID=A0A4R5BXW4_9PSEU|nr:carbohydrate kinase [Saccharopolyspora karakumensis]TDD92031.1 carbohydrate kinase [Saccharopolyspora karakumensis]